MSKQLHINRISARNAEKLEMCVTEISRLIIQINLKTNLCAWFTISGHVSWVDIMVTSSKDLYKGKEIYNPCFVNYCSYDDVFTPGDNLKELRKIIKKLQKILITNGGTK